MADLQEAKSRFGVPDEVKARTSPDGDAVMEGRWTIRHERGFGTATKGPQTEGWVPVVPCDDTAVERAARAIQHTYGQGDAARARRIVERVLRAAGETP